MAEQEKAAIDAGRIAAGWARWIAALMVAEMDPGRSGLGSTLVGAVVEASSLGSGTEGADWRRSRCRR